MAKKIYWRVRTNWRGKLILQIGVMGRHMEDIGEGGPSYVIWRDALVTDLPCNFASTFGKESNNV